MQEIVQGHHLIPVKSLEQVQKEGEARTELNRWWQSLGDVAKIVSQFVEDFQSKNARLPLFDELRPCLDSHSTIREVIVSGARIREEIWDLVARAVDSDISRITEMALALNNGRATLQLNPNLTLPRTQQQWDFHRMPGSYISSCGEGDVRAGALYDNGLGIYKSYESCPLNDYVGISAIELFLKDILPNEPGKIIDLGCGAGHNTLPYAFKFTGAELHAVDIAAPMIRYGHARARVLGQEVHFSQQNATDTSFASESFDLVLSHILIHEMSRTEKIALFEECYRLLKPGGVMLHCDLNYIFNPQNLFQEYQRWLMVNVENELFALSTSVKDLTDWYERAGFRKNEIIVRSIPNLPDLRLGNSRPMWIVCAARKV